MSHLPFVKIEPLKPSGQGLFISFLPPQMFVFSFWYHKCSSFLIGIQMADFLSRDSVFALPYRDVTNVRLFLPWHLKCSSFPSWYHQLSSFYHDFTNVFHPSASRRHKNRPGLIVTGQMFVFHDRDASSVSFMSYYDTTNACVFLS